MTRRPASASPHPLVWVALALVLLGWWLWQRRSPVLAASQESATGTLLHTRIPGAQSFDVPAQAGAVNGVLADLAGSMGLACSRNEAYVLTRPDLARPAVTAWLASAGYSAATLQQTQGVTVWKASGPAPTLLGIYTTLGNVGSLAVCAVS